MIINASSRYVQPLSVEGIFPQISQVRFETGNFEILKYSFRIRTGYLFGVQCNLEYYKFSQASLFVKLLVQERKA